MTRCGRSTAPPPSHAKKSENHVFVHTSHTTYTTRTTLSRLVSSRLVSSPLLSSHIHLFRNLLKITFANMSVGKARPCEQDTRMPINITAQKNFITLLFACFLLSDVVACSLLVGCWLYVCCMFRSEFGLVGWSSQPNTDASCQMYLHIHQTPRWTTHKKKRRQRESRVNSGVEKVQ